jgi:hypothetical protein
MLYRRQTLKHLRILILILLLFTPALHAQTPTLTRFAGADFGTGSTGSLVLPAATGAVNLVLCAFVRVGAANATVTVPGLTVIGQYQINADADTFTVLCGPGGQTAPLAVQSSASTTLRALALEFSSASTTGMLSAGREGVSSTATGPSVTTQGGGLLLEFVVLKDAATVWTPQGGLALLGMQPGGKMAVAARSSAGVSETGSIAYAPTGSGIYGGATVFLPGLAVAPPPPGDTTPPAVFVTAPGAGLISGILTVSVSATDNSGEVSSVQIVLDGQPFGPVLTAAPYQVPLDCATLSVGTHVLTATASDPSGNIGTSPPVSVTVSGELFEMTLLYDDGTAYAAGGTIAVSETIPGGSALQADVTVRISSSGRALFRWPAVNGTVYVIVVADAAGNALWQTGTELTPAQFPVQFSGATGSFRFLKSTGVWAGINSFAISY